MAGPEGECPGPATTLPFGATPFGLRPRHPPATDRTVSLTDSTAAFTISFMNYRERIVIDPHIRFGKPTIRGTRITVGDVLSYLAAGMSEDELLADFPSLDREDVRACLAYAAERERIVRDVPAA